MSRAITTGRDQDRSGSPGHRAAQLDWAGAAVREAAGTELTGLLRGPLFLPGDAGYDQERAGYNLAVEHRPAVLVGATGPADVMAAVAFATRHELPVGVLHTGHGPAGGGDGALLVSTRRMQGVRVDPVNRLARVEAGVRWEQVIHEAAPFGLAPLSGSAPDVGAVGYVLGGGLGVLGRRFGYAADHVRSLDVVTAGGVLRQAHAGQYPDLFWALRGGKGGFGVVTSMEVELVPVPCLYGGGLYFRGTHAASVLHAWRRWVRTVPEDMSSSVALVRYPLDPAVPAPLRGRLVAHVRVAYLGDAAEAESLLAPLRAVAVPLLDTLAPLPYREVGRIHDDPTTPLPLHERSAYLRELDEDAVDALLDAAGPDTSCPLRLVELRQLGGALARPPRVSNAVGHRDAGFLLCAAGVTGTAGSAGYADHLLAAMQPWRTGGVALNFLGPGDCTADQVSAAFSRGDHRRLVAVKRAYDPADVFRVGHRLPALPDTALTPSGVFA